uniref:G_PROTEIN_RECEP_F1_2 domain-containing protein n=1 Tax=Strongyloides stercoralis TaxID=6248 RepID=A0A0K0EHV9_STRER
MDFKKQIKKISSFNANTLSADDKRRIFKNSEHKKIRQHASFESSFNIPPVFPKSCSLYDSHYHGGAYNDSDLDQKILLAIKLRKSVNDSLISNSDNEPISPTGSVCSTNSGTTNDSVFEVENDKCDLHDTYKFLVNDKKKNSDNKLGIKKNSMSFYKRNDFLSEKLGLRSGRRNTDSQLHILPSLSNYNPKEWGMKPLKKKNTFKKSFERLRALSIGAAEKKKYKTGNDYFLY